MDMFKILMLACLTGILLISFSELEAAPTASKRPLTEKEREMVMKIIRENLINKLKQIYVISTRSRIG